MHAPEVDVILLSQSPARIYLIYQAIGIPFFAIEFKSAGATPAEWALGLVQMGNTMHYMRTERYVGQQIFGLIVAGDDCQFWHWDETEDKPVEFEEALNIADPNGNGRLKTVNNLHAIEANKPSLVVKNWPKIARIASA